MLTVVSAITALTDKEMKEKTGRRVLEKSNHFLAEEMDACYHINSSHRRTVRRSVGDSKADALQAAC